MSQQSASAAGPLLWPQWQANCWQVCRADWESAPSVGKVCNCLLLLECRPDPYSPGSSPCFPAPLDDWLWRRTGRFPLLVQKRVAATHRCTAMEKIGSLLMCYRRTLPITIGPPTTRVRLRPDSAILSVVLLNSFSLPIWLWLKSWWYAHGGFHLRTKLSPKSRHKLRALI